ncbi:unnamed protein product [Arabis nemorensis]|uniref:Uncharacterized protein n=1 Tax=Arabis nemorensis TaxID=586526 RepID=A0A565AUG7_9BRAS|nr:unnamed protein product [Arabis nemorensis]
MGKSRAAAFAMGVYRTLMKQFNGYEASIWMQSPHESLKTIIASELSGPAWLAALVNDVLLTLHACVKAIPDMACYSSRDCQE